MRMVLDPAGIYLLKVNNRNTLFGIFIANFEHISHFVLVFLFLTLSRWIAAGWRASPIFSLILVDIFTLPAPPLSPSSASLLESDVIFNLDFPLQEINFESQQNPIRSIFWDRKPAIYYWNTNILSQNILFTSLSLDSDKVLFERQIKYGLNFIQETLKSIQMLWNFLDSY